MNEKNNAEWVKCSDCLPKRPDTYIVTLKDGRVIADYWNNPSGMSASCIAWMNLPKGYVIDDTGHER